MQGQKPSSVGEMSPSKLRMAMAGAIRLQAGTAPICGICRGALSEVPLMMQPLYSALSVKVVARMEDALFQWAAVQSMSTQPGIWEAWTRLVQRANAEL